MRNTERVFVSEEQLFPNKVGARVICKGVIRGTEEFVVIDYTKVEGGWDCLVEKTLINNK